MTANNSRLHVFFKLRLEASAWYLYLWFWAATWTAQVNFCNMQDMEKILKFSCWGPWSSWKRQTNAEQTLLLGLEGCGHRGEPTHQQTGISAATFAAIEKQLLPHILQRYLAATNLLHVYWLIPRLLVTLFSKSPSLQNVSNLKNAKDAGWMEN